ncbi:MAG: permease prefix domain 1-containing protein [Rothia sp. (in: high G+C Gram-positive bacteria)]|nr:permease prefix domain 1-containing protein [Rothia sp. (in: high G+C Gram-positive bacteria)]
MKTLDAYLDTLFSRYPATPEFTTAKADLREMMLDKYDALTQDGAPEHTAVAQVIAEFGDFEELAPALGLEAAHTVTPQPQSITAADVQAFLNYRRAVQGKYSRSIFLFAAPFALLPLQIALFGWYTPASLTITTLITLTLVAWGLYGITEVERGSRAFYSKVRQGYRPTQDAEQLAAQAVQETRPQRTRFYALGALAFLAGIGGYAWCTYKLFTYNPRTSTVAWDSIYLFLGSALMIFALGAAIALIAAGDIECEAQRKLAAATRRHYLPHNSPYPAIRIAAYLTLPLVLLIYITGGLQTLLETFNPKESTLSFWFYPLAALFIYWVLYLTNKALMRNEH